MLVDKAFENAMKVNPKLFAKKEEPVAEKAEKVPKKRSDTAGRVMENGMVNVMKSRLSAGSSAEPTDEADETAGPPDVTIDISAGMLGSWHHSMHERISVEKGTDRQRLKLQTCSPQHWPFSVGALGEEQPLGILPVSDKLK